MKVGLGLGVCNSDDWERTLSPGGPAAPDLPDHVLLGGNTVLGDMAEPLGFDSIWTQEHFATPYGMVPDALQYLAFWAGRTSTVDLGSMVVVLPWHHPVQVAHRIAMLDVLLDGRRYEIGLGRGVSAKEYDPLGVDRNESRQRFKESVEIIRLGLTSPRFSYEGEIFQVPETSVRPQPRHRDLMEGALGAWASPESMDVCARLGLGMIYAAMGSFEQVRRDVAVFNRIREDEGMTADAQPKLVLLVNCVERAEEADRRRAAQQEALALDAMNHYGMGDPASFAGVKGYEHYASGNIAAQLADRSELDADGLFGTPDQLIERFQRIQEITSATEVILVFRNTVRQPLEEAVRSMELFAAEVLPALQEMPTPLHEAPQPVPG